LRRCLAVEGKLVVSYRLLQQAEPVVLALLLVCCLLPLFKGDRFHERRGCLGEVAFIELLFRLPAKRVEVRALVAQSGARCPLALRIDDPAFQVSYEVLCRDSFAAG
jgi:hypothetical protein